MKKIDTLKTLTRTMQSFVAIMLVTLMAVGNVVAQTTYSHTITAKTWSALDAQSLNGVNWTAAGTTTAAEPYFGFDNTKGQQFGSGNKPFSALTLTTSEIAGTITSVKVNTSGASSINATFKVKVGDTYFTSGGSDNVALTATATDYTFTGSASGNVVLEWAQTSSKAIYIKSIEITYTPAAVAVAAPVFAPVAGLYYAAQTVTITCETTGAIIHYTLDGTTPTAESAIYTAPITVDSNMTIKAIAVKDSDNSTVASATYTFPIEVANIAAFKAANTATNSTVYKITGDVTFVFENGANIYVQDTTGGLLIYDNPGLNVVTGTYNEGDVITGGLYGTYTLYNGLVEMIPTKDLAESTTNTGAVAPILATVADIQANYAQFESKLVKLSGVTFAGGTFTTNSATNINVEQDGKTMQVRNNYKTLDMTIPAGFMADVTGFVLRYNNNFQLAPRANDDIEFGPVTLPYTVDFDQNVDPGFAIENGNNTNKWYIGQAEGFDNNKLYISSTNGVTNKYDVSAASNVTASRDLVIPSNGATLTFTSRVNGESGTDMLSVYLYNYTNNIINTDYTWKEDIQGESDWTEHTINITPDHTGLARLVFAWVNNAQNGEQYPAAIDNIAVTEAACAQPIALNVTVNGADAVVTWNTADSTQNAWTLEYKLEDHNEWYSMNTTVPTANLVGLQGSSVYDVRVKANCGSESSEWTETQFEIKCLNYVQGLGDTVITIGTATNTTSLYGVWGWQYAAQLYEISQYSVLNDIAFYLGSSTSGSNSTLQMWVKAVDANYELVASNTFASMLQGAQEIYNGTGDFTEIGWINFPISGGFEIPQGKKLLVLTRGVGCTTSGGCGKSFRYTTVTGARWYKNADYNDPGQEVSGTIASYKNNIQMSLLVNKTICGDELACAAPDSVTVSDITTDGATITWKGDAENYSFEYKTGEEEWTVVAVTGNTYTLTGLEQKTAYTVRIKALCGENNNSLYSDEVEFSTASVCPVVTNITTSNLSTTTTISWTPGGNENEWNLRFRPVGSTDWVNLHISGIASTTFGGLLDQTDYEVEIMALCDPNDEENQSSWEHYEFTSGCAPFEMPYEEGFNTAARPDCWEDQDITFNGTAAVADSAAQWLMTPPIQIPVEGNTYAVIDMQGNASFMASYRGTQMNRFTEIAVLGNDSTGHYVIEIPASYKDKAVNFLFLASDNFSIDNIEFTQCPFIPVNLTAANPLNNSVELTWNGINNNGWVLEYAVAGTDAWTSVNIEQTSDTVTYTLTGLEGSTDYEFRVSTLCVGGFASQPSNVATMTTRCDAISAPYEDFNSTTYTLDCWTVVYTGTDSRSFADEDGTYAHRLKMYNYYNRALDSTDNTALGDLYAILPMIDTTLNVLQINFTAEIMRSYDPTVDFQLGVITDINRPEQTFMPLSNYTAVFDAAEYTYILNNVEYAGNLAFRVKKSTETKDLRLSNIKVEYIPACQKPINFVATPTSETTMSLNWGTIGRQTNWDIKYKEGQYYASEPDETYTSMTANLRPRIVNNLTYGAWYTFYIRNHCSATEQSEWVGPYRKQLLLEFNIANNTTVTSCNGTVVYQEDTTGTNIMTLNASAAGSWVVLNGSVNLGSDTLFVYDGDTVNASKLLAKITGSKSNLTIKPNCESNMTLYLKKSANSNPTINLAIDCEELPTCSAPSTPVLNEETYVLTWESGCWGTAASYNIQMIDHTAGTTEEFTSTETSFAVTNMLKDHVFTFKVQPVCDTVPGEWSEESDEYIKIACGAPTTVTATYNESTRTATVTWTPFLPTQRNFAVGYKLHNAASWIFTPLTNVTSYTWTTPVLDELQTYDICVKAICMDEESGLATTTVETPCVTQQYAEGVVEMGSGTSTNTYLPTYVFYNYSLTQQIYTAEEIGMSGRISGVAFYYTGTYSRNVDIYLAHTEKSTFASTTDWVRVTSDNLVYRGTLSPTANAWTTINFTTPFEYNGRDNLVLIVDDNTGSYVSSVAARVYDASNQALRIYSDGTNYDAENPSSYTGTLMSVKNQVQFNIAGIMCTPIVSCPAPSNVTLANYDTESATINWSKGGNETEWVVTYTLNDEEYTVTATDTFLTITGLQSDTTYSLAVSVEANCDATHRSEAATGNFTFVTPCVANITITAENPYVEDFESYTQELDQQAPVANCWNVLKKESSYNSPFIYNNVTSVNPHSGNYTIEFKGTSSLVVLPAFTNDLNTLSMSFWANRTSSSYGTLEVGVISNLADLTSFQTIQTISSVPTRSNGMALVGPIEIANAPANSYIALRYTSTSGSYSWNLDDFSVFLSPTCSSPKNLVYSDNVVSWTPGSHGTPTSYTVQYRPVGTETWSSDNTVDTFYRFSGLDLSTTYEVMVSANCSATDQSDPSTAIEFTTPPCVGGATVNLTSGTNTSSYIPAHAYYKYSYSQQIFKASEINAPNGGEISSITIQVNSGSTTRNWNVYLMHTTENTVSSWLPLTNATLVYSGNVSYSPGDVTIDFTTPFPYNGRDNIVLIVDDNTGSYSSSHYFKTHTAHSNCTRYVYSDGTNYNPNEMTVTGTAYSYRNNVYFDVCPPVSCSTPTGITFDLDSKTLSWNAGNNGTPENYNLRYRVQGDANWIEVPVRTTSYTFTTLALNTTYEYQIQANCGSVDGLSDWSKKGTFTTPCSFCSFDLLMADSYGDGWNGASIAVYQADELIGTYTLSGSYDELNIPICNDTALISFVWTSGSFDSECSMLIEHNGTVVYYGGAPSSGTFASFAPSCNPCSTPSGFSINTRTGVLSWSGNANSYELQYRVAGVEEFTTVTVTDTFYTFTNLIEGETYQFKVQGDCGTEGISSWTPLMQFRVPRTCPAPLDVPFMEDFEATSLTRDCWTLYDGDGDGQNWFVYEPATISDDNGNPYVFDAACMTSASYNSVALTPDNWLVSPAINIAPNAQLSFWTRGQDPSWAAEYYSVYVATQNRISAFLATTPVDSNIATDRYVETVVDMSAYAGQTVYIAFRHHNVTDQFRLNVDNVSITTHPSCSTPMGLTYENDTLIWNQGIYGTPASYNVHYRLLGDTTWTTAVVDTNFFVPARWESNSSYEAQVQANCGVNDLSEWSEIIRFKTPITCFTPTELAVSNVTDSSATITWADSYNQTNYAVEYKAENDTTWTTVAGDTTHTVTLTNLNYLTTYIVRMKTVCNEYDESEYTNEVEFTTLCAGGYDNEVDFSFANSQSDYQYLPFYGYYKFTYSQQIYDASELNTGATEISSISFKCSGAPSAAYTGGIHIWLGQTDKSTFANNTDYVDVNTLTEVFAMPETESYQYVAGEWNTFTFDTPFQYDGTSNLVVAYYEGMDGGSYDRGYFYAHTTADNKSIGHYSDTKSSVSYTNPATATGTKSFAKYRNDIILNMGGQYCPPDTDLAVVSIEPITDACDLSNAKVTIEVKNNSFLNAVNGFTATLALNDTADVVTETVNATIEPNGTYTFTFAHVPAYTDGSNNIMVTVNTENDMVEDNNVITLNDVRQVVPATVPYEQDFSAVVIGRDAWTQGTENNNPNLWTINNGVLTFMDNDTLDAQNYVITHCIDIPAGQMQVSYDYNALSNMPENLNVYMGTTPDIASMTLIGSHSNFTKADEDYTFNYLFNNENEGVYFFAIEALSTKGNVGVSFDNLAIMPMVDVTVIAGPNGTVNPNGTVKVPYNGDLTINIVPDNMYHTAGVWVDGERVMNEDPYNASFMMYTLANITESHTINVEFKMEFHINKYAYNYSDQYAEVGGHFVPAQADTLLDPSGHVVTMIADENYSLHSLVVGIIPPASEGAIIDGDNVIADVTYDPATRTYTYMFDTLYVSNYYVQACFKKDTVAINYTTITGVGVYDGVSVAAGETHNTWVDYGTDFTSSILPADGYYNMGVTVNGVDTGIIDHYDFDSVITTQYVTAQFGHKVTATIMNINNNEYLGSDEVRGTIAPAEQMILSGSSCSVAGTIQEHFHLSNFFVNGVDMLADVIWDGYNFSYTIDSLIANTEINAVVRIDSIAIYYTVDGGNGYVNGNLLEAPALDTAYVEYGSDFLSQFAAAEGYHIVNVTVNGTAYDEIPVWLTEFITMPQYITVTFALNEYDITTAAHGNGSVTPGVHVVYDPQSSYTFTATPAEGYHISQIMRNNESLVITDPESAYTETIAPVLSDYNYVAYFAPNIYTVTATCGANGTIDPYGAQSYEYGATPTYTVTANTGYAIEHVYVDGTEVTLTNGTYTFAALAADHTITATFAEDNYTITASAGNGGSIDPAGENVVMSGSTVVYTITPATGYEIADVTVDNVSVGAVATYTFENVNANHTIAATFNALQFTITATAGANGTITPAGAHEYAYGATPTYTVTANTGYEVDYVTVDGQNVTLTNGAYTFPAVTENHEIFAAFKVKSYTITVTDPANGTITPNGVITVNHGATPTFTIAPATGYEVTAITVNGTNVIANAQPAIMGAYTYTFPAVTANRTLTATMTKKHFTITATAGANGTITGLPTVEYGANATYTITPNAGYEIANVTVDGMSVGAVATYTFHNVTANHIINATFTVEPCVIPSNLQTINIDSTSATLTWYHPGADSYDIQYKTATANTWTVVSNVPGFAYNLTNLQTSTTYVWKIKANTIGCTNTDWSNATSFTTLSGPGPQIGIADYVKSHVNVYAEHNRVHIVNDYNVDIDNVSIYDMYGKLIYSGNAINNPEVIELNVAVGTYVVRLNTQQGPAVYKVHINR